VDPAVVLHVVAQLEGLAAVLALEGAVARVRRQVRDEGAHVGERLAAELADDGVAAGGRVQLHEGRVVEVRHGEVGADGHAHGPAPAAQVAVHQGQGLEAGGQQAVGVLEHLLAQLEGLQAVR